MTSATAQKVTSHDVVTMLQRHYLPENRPASGVLAVEIGAPGSPRRADAIWAPITNAGRAGLVGHEIKVSRADVMTELADPMKADVWAQHCDRWYLTVSDPALVEGLDVPDHWGIMAPPSGRRTRSMTIVREAPRLKPADAAPAFQRVLSWYANHIGTNVGQLEREVRWRQDTIDRQSHTIDELRLNGAGHASPHASRVNGLLAAITKGARDERIWQEIDDDLIVRAVLDLAKVVHLRAAAVREVERLVREVRSVVEPFKYVAADLEALTKSIGGDE